MSELGSRRSVDGVLYFDLWNEPIIKTGEYGGVGGCDTYTRLKSDGTIRLEGATCYYRVILPEAQTEEERGMVSRVEDSIQGVLAQSVKGTPGGGPARARAMFEAGIDGWQGTDMDPAVIGAGSGVPPRSGAVPPGAIPLYGGGHTAGYVCGFEKDGVKHWFEFPETIYRDC